MISFVIVTLFFGFTLLKTPLSEGATQPYSGSCPDVNLAQCTGQGCGFLWLGSCTWESYWGFDPNFGFWGTMWHCTCTKLIANPVP